MDHADWNLVQACRRGDEASWEALVARYERLVFSIALNFGLSRDDAADVMQHTFVELLKSIDTLKEDGNLAGWLGTVARRHTWRLAQRRRRETTDTDEEVLMGFRDSSAEETHTRWERMEWLHAGLLRLDERCRRLLLALYFAEEEPAYADIAEQLGMAVGSIGPTRARCLQRLKGLL